MLRYVAITPARDEREHLPRVADCFATQSVLPAAWVVVDDGSSDGTAAWVEAFSSRFPWCHLVSLPNRGKRLRGAGVVEAFRAGYNLVRHMPHDAIVKVDADVSFETDVFERLLAHLSGQHKLGICGGGILIEGPEPGNWAPDRLLPTTFVRGPMKLYRRSCFEAIDGLVPHKGWDGIDNIKAMTLGWTVCRFDELAVRHHRYLGEATGVLRSSFENGYGGYFMGSLFSYNLYEASHFMTRRPYVVRGVAMIAGYLWGALINNRLKDDSVIAFIRREQEQLLPWRRWTRAKS